MSVYLRAKFEVSSVILTSFRQWGGIIYPPQNEQLKSPPRLGLRIVSIFVVNDSLVDTYGIVTDVC